MSIPKRTQVGRIAGAFGLRGQLKVETISNFPARFDKGNTLYINDGTYGGLFDAGSALKVRFPVRGIRPEGAFGDETREFRFAGPTCDSIDMMKGPFVLPADIQMGDWIEIGNIGVYSQGMRTNFNGFYSDTLVEVADKPLLSMFGIN